MLLLSRDPLSVDYLNTNELDRKCHCAWYIPCAMKFMVKLYIFLHIVKVHTNMKYYTYSYIYLNIPYIVIRAHYVL